MTEPDDGPVFHIVAADEWAAAGDPYEHPSLASEGFIHFSSAAQAGPTTDRYYSAITGLVLLEVDQAALPQPMQWDPAPVTSPVAGQLFPHLYTGLPKAAVEAVHPWEPADQASWRARYPE